MKENLARSLKNSLSEQRRAEKSKYNDIENRFAKAEKLFDQETEITGQIEIKIHSQEKVIRDTFTIPSKEYKLIGFCKERLLKKGFNINKSELIRAGLILLNKLSDEELLQSCKQIEKVKTGRPK